MPILELLRGDCFGGGVASVPPAAIDEIISGNSAVEVADSSVERKEEEETNNKSAASLRRMSRAKAKDALSEEARKERWKKAHEYCRAVVPRRIKDFSPYLDGSGDYKWQKDNDGNQIWRLRQFGDPDYISIRTRHAPTPASERQNTGTRPYNFWCPIWESHTQLADFGIGVGLYYSMLVVWMIFLGALFLINTPAMFCNAEFKKTLNSYKTCRNMTQSNAAGLSFSAWNNASVYGVSAYDCGSKLNMLPSAERSSITTYEIQSVPSFCK
jgi:hypothetical protein